MELTNLSCLAVLLLALLYACNGFSTLQHLNTSTPASPNIPTTSFPCKKLHPRFLRSNNFEGFSSPTGTWKVVDGSQLLGPKEDHTTGTRAGHYAVVSGNVSEIPLLGSYLDVFCEPICMSVYYSMPGKGHVINGGLDVISGPFGSNNVTTIASIGNYSSDGWHQSKVTLRPRNEVLIYKLKGRSPDPKGSFSLAIDDISYTRGECTDETTTTPDPSTTASTCKQLNPRFLRSNNFEGFSFQKGTWKVVDGSQQLGPKEDHTYGTSAGHYAVVSGNVSEVPLLGSYLDVFCEPICMSFYYSMPGSGNVTDGGLDVISGPLGSNSSTTIASIDSYSSDGWQQSKVTLRPRNEVLIYKLRGRSPDPKGSFSLAIDDISYTRGECTDETTTTSLPSTTTSGMETTTEPFQSPTTRKDATSESSETTSVHSLSSRMPTSPATNPPSESTMSSQLSSEASPTTGYYTTTNMIGTTAENFTAQTTVDSASTTFSMAAPTVTHNIMVNTTVNTTPVTPKTVSATKTTYYQNTTLNAYASQTAPYNSTSSSILTEVTNSTTSVSISATTSTSKMASTSKPTSTVESASTSEPTSTSEPVSTSEPASASVITSKTTPAFATSPTTQITTPKTHLTKSTTSIGASGDNNKQNKNGSSDSSKETPWFTWMIAGVAGVLVLLLIVIALVVWRRRRRGKTVLEPVRTYSMNSKPFDDDLAVGNPLYGENESTPV